MLVTVDIEHKLLGMKKRTSLNVIKTKKRGMAMRYIQFGVRVIELCWYEHQVG